MKYNTNDWRNTIMKELRNDKLFYKSKKLYHDMLKLKAVDVDNYYCANLFDWFDEVILKNISIHKSKKDKNQIDQEVYKKSRQHVYWINFGRNIGSEFQDYHYAVVLFETKYTAIVVPLTSKKEHDPKWISIHKDVLVDLGKVEGYPNDSKECYACTFMIQTVSKKRLSRCGNKTDGYFNIKISNDQMDLICNKINELTYNKVKHTIDN